MQNLSAVDFLSQLQNQTTPYSLVLDIDDTLIDCRHRKKMILRSFVEQVWNAGNYQHDDLQRLLDIKQDQVRFRISECLAAISIEHASLEKELFDYWLRHYFTYPYLKQDIAFDGAIAFTKACLDAGAHMIYLTGRDEGGMGQGTRERLAELGFPLNDERCKLILKSDPEQADLDFKQSAIRTIAEKEPPVATGLPDRRHEERAAVLQARAVRRDQRRQDGDDDDGDEDVEADHRAAVLAEIVPELGQHGAPLALRRGGRGPDLCIGAGHRVSA